MSNNHQRVSAPSRQSEIKRILIYIGLTLAVNFIDSIFLTRIVSLLYQAYPATAAILLIGYARTFIHCCISVFLYRKYVFRSRSRQLAGVFILFGLRILPSILFSLLGVSLYSLGTLANLMQYGALAAFYFIARNRLYLDGREDGGRVLSAHANASTDNDPDVLSVDLDDIQKRKQKQQFNRIVGKSNQDTSARRSVMGLARKLDLENDSERVIAKSSRDAIRVMEHKALNIKHEWNCDDHDARSTDVEPERVIAKGSNAIHVAEHSDLNMKHEWNCDDRR